MKRYFIACLLAVTLLSFQTAPKKTAQAKTGTLAPAAGLQASIDRGKTIYLKRCLVCHQVDGGGVPHLNAPLDGASQVIGKDKERIIRIVLNGMNEKVELDGEIYSNIMLPQKDLSDQEVADVLTYARNSWTNKASAVTPAEVKAVRAKLK
ncbi:cytochrome c [Sediminibacterium roseum]|uniref:Cytochrome c n=1 Tax=Sediminibacterium roseum TaxID=1978412 RepID=A0ABW9ZV99_9BACT|nr:cytochrome c [Sediminibacterium roseum]NCI51092.1 cytochrome c [Sediminibacterium roseum]